MSDFQTIDIDYDGPVAVLRFNRPDKLNAFNSQMSAELRQAAGKVNLDEAVRVVVLSGNGRAFSAGADLSDGLAADEDLYALLNAQYTPALMAISTAPKPWISAVNGAAAGIGSAFAMCCDLTVMAEDAYLYQAFAAIGLIPDGGATWHLARTVGRKRAYELMAGGEKLRAANCLDYGLCNRVVAPDKLMDETMAWARELAQKAPLSLRFAKQSLNEAMQASLLETIFNEFKLQAPLLGSEDAAEGVAAFLAKRPAVFQGR